MWGKLNFIRWNDWFFNKIIKKRKNIIKSWRWYKSALKSIKGIITIFLLLALIIFYFKNNY